MIRAIYQSLLKWKSGKMRQPLILSGARQVGKTWLLKNFGKNEYKNMVYINFEDAPGFKVHFERDLKIPRILAALETESHEKIEPQSTLIIFDEIQECHRALASLKYFAENAPEYHIAAAGSLLGVSMHEGISFPVGKVDRIEMHPMSFAEFLAVAEPRLHKVLLSQDFDLINDLSEKFIDTLKTYLFIGGMPRVVASYASDRDFEQAREIQNGILKDHAADFSKHIKGINIPKVRMLFDSIPMHLAKEKKKFIYKEIKEGGRAKEFEDAMDWLVNSGVVHKVPNITTPNMPLSNYAEREIFKLYMVDVGLLSAKSGVKMSVFLNPNYEVFSHFNGALTEQFVLQELKVFLDMPVCYWRREKGDAEVDFIVQSEDRIIPIEAKAGKSTKAKSLSVYIQKYNPKIAVRVSLKNYGKEGNLLSLPLYLLGMFREL
ncbi:MAG: ATP-binding protein [Fibromonadaceae bacterium]|jgi:predicted AAA+ superfamily ATPase|nr:ATP-binding protein [Fibromonadaceae bacterium]